MGDHLGGLVWLGLGRSTTSVYVPFYAGHQQMPRSYLEGFESEFSLESSWWAFSLVANLAQLKWSLMFEDIRKEQQGLESAMFANQHHLEQRALEIAETSSVEGSMAWLQEQVNAQATHVTKAWWTLAWRLVSSYSNGFVTK